MVKASVPESLTHKASKSVFWTGLGNMSVSVMKFATTIVLARLLSPKDFGILGMAILVTGIINLFANMGIGAAIIQKKDLQQEHLSTVYWANILMGLALTVVGIISAPFAAIFFNEPILQNIIICLSVNFIIGNLAATQVLIFVKDLQYKKLTIIEIISAIIRVVVVLFLAWAGLGVWSIVWGIIIERIIKTILIIYQVRWKPQRIFDKQKFHELFHFGKNLYGENFVYYLNTNIDYMLTGKLLGASSLGFYNFAYNIPHLILNYMTDIVLSVLYPIYCKAQDDLARMARGYLKTVQYISVITFPLLAGLFFVATDFTHLVYGEKWLPAVAPLQILCVSSALLSIISTGGSLCAALGRPEISFRWSLIKFPVTILAVVIGSYWGIIGIAWATAFMAVFSLIFIRLGLRLIHTSFRQYLYALWPAAGSSLLMLTVMWITNQAFHYEDLILWLRFVLNVLMGVSTYFLFMRFIFKDVFQDFLDFFRKMFEGRR